MMKTKNLFLFLCLVSAVSCASPTSAPNPVPSPLPMDLPSRIQALRPEPKDFFFKPKTVEEKALYQTGLLHYWQQYGKSSSPQDQDYKGYILFADPYHYGLKKISFLLGADCSNFVHRVYQMMGIRFHYMKTRHWIHLAKAKVDPRVKNYYEKQNRTHTPIDLKKCEWDQLLKDFELVRDPQTIQIGDFIVYPKAEGILGTKGHIGFVSQLNPPMVLQSKSRKEGIVLEPIENTEFYTLRWKGPIDPLQTTGWAERLAQTYPESPGACP